MPVITDALELLTAQHEQIEDLYEQVRQIGDDAVLVELADKLTTHLALETEVFYPAVRKLVKPAVMAELLAEHAAMKQVIGELQWLSAKDPQFRVTLDRLGTLLFGHSSWQEDELFTKAAESMSCDELAGLCVQFYNFDSIPIAA
jgi:hemerythrin HHE cation binding domain-containing protein